MTDYGRRLAREIAAALARAGVVIISGLAQGVDSTAHSAALDVEGETVAVLGEGLVAFAETGTIHRRHLAKEIAAHGAVVSEYPLDAPGAYWTFPRRNETVVGLSDAVVVIEAPHESGALITAEFARAHGKPLFAAPGSLGASTWAGSNALIASGVATLLRSADQVASLFGITLAPSFGRMVAGPFVPTVAAPFGPTAAPSPVAASPIHAQRVLELLSPSAADVDSIAAGLGMSTSETTTLLAEMLIAGSVIATGDGRFARK